MDLLGRPFANIVIGDFLRDVEQDAENPNRQFFPRHDAFELPENQFIKIYCLNKDLADNIIDRVEELYPPRRKSALDATTKVLTALRFFAAGSYQMDVGKNIYMGISQPSVSRCIRDVLEIFNRDFFNEWVRFPETIAEMNTIRRGFYENYGFPGTVGCVDGTQIAIYPPNIGHAIYPENDYVNRKHYHSINTQLICDSNMRILHVNARYPGCTHDSFIWENCNVLPLMRRLHQLGHNSYFLIGDSGYKLRTWFLTPLDDPEPNTPESRYNQCFKTTRSIIERCNGLLKMRFRCLLKHRVLHYAPTIASKIINTCTVLHNMCIDHNVPLIQDEEDAEVGDLGIYAPTEEELLKVLEDARRLRVDPDLARGRAFQRRIIERHFA